MNDTAPPMTPRPIIGVGVVVLRAGPTGPEVLLIERGRPPRQGEWSIPGGCQGWGKAVQETAHRELMEETGVTVTGLRFVDVVDALWHTPEGTLERHMTLIDYRGLWSGGNARAGDDASDVKWVPVSGLARYNLWSETIRIIEAAVALGGV